jgi:hypothetical protein
VGRIGSVALTFGVTPRAATVRAVSLELVDRGSAQAVVALLDQRAGATDSGGGSFYLNTLGELGPSFIDLVFSAVDARAVTLSEASRLLGPKINHFPTLRETLNKRLAGE